MALTRRRDLRTGTPPWRAAGRGPLEGRQLPPAQRCDVVVVGAGISGALIADALLREGLQVVMVDRRGAARGSTPASTALLLYELDQPLVRLSRKLGWAAARQVWLRSRLAQLALEERVGALELKCGLVHRDALYLSGTELDDEGLQSELARRRDAGFECEWLSRRQVRDQFGIERRSALLSHGNLQANPLALTLGLLRNCVARGLKIYTPCEVTEVHSSSREVRLRTADGQRLRARYAVFATGYEPLKSLPCRGLGISSTWVLSTPPQPRRLWPGQCLIWEASSPYLYLRTDARGRIICGGEDESGLQPAARDRLLPAKVRVLQRKLARLLPGVSTRVQHAWTASFGTSNSGLPLIGPVPGRERCLVAMGYGGNGITFSMLAAQLIRARISGRPDADAPLFGF